MNVASGPALTGKAALVTGGGTGIGKGCAAALAAAGATVTICGPELAVLESAAAEISGHIRVIQADVTVEEQVAAAVETALVDGRLDIALANAGTGFPGSILHLSAEHWMVPLGVNVLGSAFTIKHAAARMKDTGGGSIITMSSIASTRHTAWMGAYGVSKAALDELTRVAAVEPRSTRNSGQRDPPRLGADRIAGWDIHSRQSRARPARDAPWPVGSAGRHREGRAVFRVGSVRVGHRPAARCLRRLHAASTIGGCAGAGSTGIHRRNGQRLRTSAAVASGGGDHAVYRRRSGKLRTHQLGAANHLHVRGGMRVQLRNDRRLGVIDLVTLRCLKRDLHRVGRLVGGAVDGAQLGRRVTTAFGARTDLDVLRMLGIPGVLVCRATAGVSSQQEDHGNQRQRRDTRDGPRPIWGWWKSTDRSWIRSAPRPRH